MKAGAPFARQGAFKTSDQTALAMALALLEQRTGDKFAAIDAIDGDVVGTWQPYDRAFEGASLGNGRIQASWRYVAGRSVQIRILVEAGSTTAIPSAGFVVRPPPLLAFDPDGALFPRDHSLAYLPTTYGGLFAGSYNGGATVATLDGAGECRILGNRGPPLNSGDRVAFSFEVPVRKASS